MEQEVETAKGKLNDQVATEKAVLQVRHQLLSLPLFVPTVAVIVADCSLTFYVMYFWGNILSKLFFLVKLSRSVGQLLVVNSEASG